MSVASPDEATLRSWAFRLQSGCPLLQWGEKLPMGIEWEAAARIKVRHRIEETNETLLSFCAQVLSLVRVTVLGLVQGCAAHSPAEC